MTLVTSRSPTPQRNSCLKGGATNVGADMIKSPEMRSIWDALRPHLMPEDIAKLAVGPKILTSKQFSTWETVLSEIITGDASWC